MWFLNNFFISKYFKKYKLDCERGCRYFNIEFLTTASNTEKVTDLNTTENQCKLCKYLQYTFYTQFYLIELNMYMK